MVLLKLLFYGRARSQVRAAEEASELVIISNSRRYASKVSGLARQTTTNSRPSRSETLMEARTATRRAMIWSATMRSCPERGPVETGATETTEALLLRKSADRALAKSRWPSRLSL